MAGAKSVVGGITKASKWGGRVTVRGGIGAGIALALSTSPNARAAGETVGDFVFNRALPAVGSVLGGTVDFIEGLFSDTEAPHITPPQIVIGSGDNSGSSEGQTARPGEHTVVSGDTWIGILGQMGLSETEIYDCVAEQNLGADLLSVGEVVSNPCD